MAAPSLATPIATAAPERLPWTEGSWHGVLHRRLDGQFRLAWVDTEAGEVRAATDLAAPPTPDNVWTSFLQAMGSPLEGQAGRPYTATWPEITVLQLLQERARPLGVTFQSPDPCSETGTLSYEAAGDAEAVSRFTETAVRLDRGAGTHPFSDEDMRVVGLAAAPVRLRAGRSAYGDAELAVLAGDGEEPLASYRMVPSREVPPLLLTEFQRHGWQLHRGEYRKDWPDEWEEPTVHYVRVPLAETAEPLETPEGLEQLRLLTRAMQLVEILPRHAELREHPVSLADGSEVRVTWRSWAVRRQEEADARAAQLLESELRALEDPVEQATRMALAAAGVEDPGRRSALLDRALLTDPRCVEARIQAAVDQGELDERIRLLKEAVTTGTGRRRLLALRHLVVELWNSGRRAEALDVCQEAVCQDPQDESGLAPLLSQMLLAERRFEESEALLRRTPDRSTWWHFDRALLEFLRHGDSAEARDHLYQATLVNPHVLRRLGEHGIGEPPASPAPASPKEAEHYVYYARPNWGSWRSPAVTWARSVPDRRAPVRPERPKPHQACWCGGRFKYKECHMAADDRLAKLRAK